MPLELLLQQARAVERAWGEAWVSLSSVAGQPQTIAEDTPNFVRVYTPGAREMLLNIVLRFSSDRVVTSQDIEEVIAPFRYHRLPFQWWLTLGAEPPGLRDHLHELGMQTWGGATSMTLSLVEWEPRYPSVVGAYTLGRVASPEDGDAALQVICAVFFVPREPMARWTTLNPHASIYLAYLDGKPACSLAMVQRSGVVGIYHVATLPFARRRGIAGNLLIMALRDAIKAGCTMATLTATPEARHLYERLGFRTCGLLEQWVPGHELTRSLVSGRPLPA